MSGGESGFETVAGGVAGIPVAEQGVDLVNAAAEALDGELTGGAAAAAFGVGSEIYSAAQDPIGYFAASGVGWVIEHVPFLKDALDAVSGNPEDIDRVSKEWKEKVGEALVTVGDDVRAAAAVTTDGWSGDAGDAYRKATESLATISDAMSRSAAKSAGGLAAAGSFVVEVRNTIRDELSKLCVWVVATVAAGAAASVPTAGASVVTATNSVLYRAAVTAQRFSSLLQKLGAKLKTMATKMSDLTSATRALRAATNSVDWQGAVNAATTVAGSSPVTASAREWGITGIGSALKVAGDGMAASAASAPPAR
ncbi:ESX-1 secretion-associated protein EspA/EspE-like domain-containing protein OS=Tsukamurella paurometabola(strain ATCC 8368 / DSM / CCUG 35730 / CIP 100753/ JCM 10117 / KCTC 9821 / NBRC 16120 / NCIMB 702349 / NCTC 13040) OX=521096 GN=Tpau_2528 PE=4 SV=1 [Tsukamurella paurometabola]|uniref:Outer membrane channel protein CpnT-like N-terminal domain-containing protein n=1 Tax=Tsukamurella paurometabola (strain ATCC 8368 / DSM 20162 / CCUG 35730 / CIP 100753 / JCM 10117 / KCTC 9821 / NBRC 16120 / NCIMB 702349 / NCTC 13040) TaxID=521096 RepID=D5URS7_TSUPD|nr:hypothetical protein [Tsukamurella paurometabola]ADG79132.1 hypothetical protein Tpau_2528 [Tsukamurella paurometabola DSM 20162]SUP34205.1 Uncharacterised protein [Tsukamurella paurometabola]